MTEKYKQPAVYMMTSSNNSVLYIGVTSNLVQRIYTHRQNLVPGFTQKYNCHKLVYFEVHSTMEVAIAREKQLKSWRRSRKSELIDGLNPDWKDLYNSII